MVVSPSLLGGGIFAILIMSERNNWTSDTVSERSTALWTVRITGSYALTMVRTAVVRWSGLLRHKTRIISFRSRIERITERYSRASLCVISDRSVESSAVANIDITIDKECCSRAG